MSRREEIQKRNYDNNTHANQNPVRYTETTNTTYFFENDKWTPKSLDFDKKSDKTSFHTYSLWNIDKQDWEVYRKEVDETDDKHIRKQAYYHRPDGKKWLEGYQNTTTIPFNDNDKER